MLDALLMTEESSLRLALIGLLGLVSDHPAAVRSVVQSEGKALVFCLTQVRIFGSLLSIIWLFYRALLVPQRSGTHAQVHKHVATTWCVSTKKLT